MTKTTTLLLVVIALFSSGCGFKPLYSEGQQGLVARQLSDISITEQKTRTGQLVRNNLMAEIAPAGSYPNQVYRLDLNAISDIDNIIDDDDDGVLRRTYRMKVIYNLIELKTGREVTSGKTFSNVSFDRTTAAFSNVQAKSNAEERAAKEISTDILTRLSAYFSSQAK